MVKCYICGNKVEPITVVLLPNSETREYIEGEVLAKGEELVNYDPDTCLNEDCRQIYRDNIEYINFERVTQAMADDARAWGDGGYYG